MHLCQVGTFELNYVRIASSSRPHPLLVPTIGWFHIDGGDDKPELLLSLFFTLFVISTFQAPPASKSMVPASIDQ